MYFQRFDICEAYAVLEWEWHLGGWLHERPSNQRRMEATSCQLARMRFVPSPMLGGYCDLTENGKAIYDLAAQRYGLPVE